MCLTSRAGWFILPGMEDKMTIEVIPVEGMKGFYELYVNGKKRRAKMSRKAVARTISNAIRVREIEYDG